MHTHECEKVKAGGGSPELQTTHGAVTPSGMRVRSMPPTGPKADDDTLLTSTQVRSRIGGVSNMCIWRWMRDPRVEFPSPIKINQRNYWRLGDLRQWQAARAVKET